MVPMSSPRDDVTLLLRRWSHGDRGALDELMPLIYRELHKLAKRHMTQQEAGHTLQTTAVIHEAYLKLGGSSDKDWANRAHFFGVAAKAMRHVLVDHFLAPLEEARMAWRLRKTWRIPKKGSGEKRTRSLTEDAASNSSQTGFMLSPLAVSPVRR